MAISPMSEVLRHLRSAVLVQDGAGLTDGQLLEEFITQRDEAAGAALVRRHAPLVWGVCRRFLRSSHDAEDAFQATFLVLVRRASSIMPRETVASWLYGVACKVALKMRATAARRKSREKQVIGMPEREVAAPDRSSDLQLLIAQELNRLPDKFRVVVLFCDLQGKTRKEASRQLDVPEGTVAGWLARGRALLAKRLVRHGLAVSGVSLAGLLSQNLASACVPTSVLSSTVKAVTLFPAEHAAAGGVITAQVATLTKGVLRSMSTGKWKTVMAALVLAVLGYGLTSLVSYNLQAAEQAGAKKEAAGPAKPGARDLAAVRKARLVAARKAFTTIRELYQKGSHDEEQVYRWSVRLSEAERAVGGAKAERVAAFEAHLFRMKELEEWARDRLPIGPLQPTPTLRLPDGRLPFRTDKGSTILAAQGIARSDVAVLTTFYRAEAEVWLAEAKAE